MKIIPYSLRKFVSKVLLNPVGWLYWIVLTIFLISGFSPTLVLFGFILAICIINFLPYYLIKEKESKIRIPKETFEAESIHILVLGGGHVPNPEIILEQQLNNNSLRRVLEGVRLYNNLPNSSLIMFGKSLKFGHPSQAEIQSKVAMTMGVPAKSIIVISEPSNTEEEALFYFNKFGEKKRLIILVTKALHMERANYIFSSFDYNIILSPSYFIYKNFKPSLSWFLVPDFNLLICFGEYLKEITGLVILMIQYKFGYKLVQSKNVKNKNYVNQSGSGTFREIDNLKKVYSNDKNGKDYGILIEKNI